MLVKKGTKECIIFKIVSSNVKEEGKEDEKMDKYGDFCRGQCRL